MPGNPELGEPKRLQPGRARSIRSYSSAREPAPLNWALTFLMWVEAQGRNHTKAGPPECRWNR